MNDDTPASTPEATAAKLEKAVDEAIAEAPAPASWSVVVTWTKDSTDEEKADAEKNFITAFAKEIGLSPKDHLPACIDKVTIQRIHEGE